MRKTILNNLSLLETTYNIKILYAVESGSRAWGFESINSDYDIRFIYVQSLDYYLGISNSYKDTIEKMIVENDLDFSGWELKKALRLFAKSNPCLLEWLDSSIVYYSDDIFTEKLKSLRDDFFDAKSSIYHYLHMAKNNFDAFLQRDKVKLKKYFYVLRPVLCCSWIFRTNSHSPMLFDTLVQHELEDLEIKNIVSDLLIKKKSGNELNEGDRIHKLNEYLISKIDLYFKKVKDLQVKTIPQNNAILNDFCKQTIMQNIITPKHFSTKG